MITRALAAHAGWLSAVHHAAFPLAEAWSTAAFAGQMEAPGVFGLLHPDGALVLARVAAEEAEILTLAVLPEQRRRGLARALLCGAADAAAAIGARTLYLEVSETNQAARQLYAGLGYQQAGRRPAYYADGTDALVLRLMLDPDAATPR